jgi:ketosteroid isomerase-like protein
MKERSTAADIEKLESLAGEWAQGEFWNADAYAEDVVFVVSGPEGGEYQGHQGLGMAWRSFLSAWEDFRVEVERVIPGKEGRYVLLLTNRGRGKGSGMQLDAKVANVLSMHEGKIARLEMFWDRDAALAAAGVSEEPA